jgi:purine-nucleoside/S-methyl-5'-thioadenosine phosphorylase / adenosine deaminase
VLTLDAWRSIPGLRHGFLDRGECGGGRSWEVVLAAAGAPFPIALPRQVHGTGIVSGRVAMDPVEADAVASGTNGLLAGIVTADCVPILLVHRGRRAAGAVHAGWRGATAGVLETAVRHLGSELHAPAAELEAAIGPAICGRCYQVGPEVIEAFRARTGETTAPAWSERAGRHHVDLRHAVELLLRAVGVAAVSVVGPCTACGAGFCSYRRDGAGCGRQLSFVGWV